MAKDSTCSPLHKYPRCSTMAQPYESTSSAEGLVCSFVRGQNDLQQATAGASIIQWDLCSQPRTVQLSWHSPVNTRTVKCSTNVMLLATSSSITSFGGSEDGLGKCMLGGMQRPPCASHQLHECCLDLLSDLHNAVYVSKDFQFEYP